MGYLTTVTSLRKHLIVCVFVSVLGMMRSAADARSYRLILSSKALCVDTVLVPGMDFIIDYDAPDLKLSNREDMMIEIYTNHDRDPGPPIQRFEIKVQEDSIALPTLDISMRTDGHLRICTKAIYASRQDPRRISIHVHPLSPPPFKPPPDQSHVVDKLARMQYEIDRLATEAEYVLGTAVQMKKQSVVFHKQFIAMRSATKWWPILQIVLLCGAAVMQAKFMVTYLSKRHVV